LTFLFINNDKIGAQDKKNAHCLKEVEKNQLPLMAKYLWVI